MKWSHVFILEIDIIFLVTSPRQRGKPENCRRVFNQVVNSVTDDVERMCEEYVQFEREEGTLDSYDATLVRIASQMDRVRERQEKVWLVGAV